MMHYRLRENLSCCDVNGHMIFLDMAQDRYFRLTGRLEVAMRRFLEHERISYTLLEHLVTAGNVVLVDACEKAKVEIHRLLAELNVKDAAEDLLAMLGD